MTYFLFIYSIFLFVLISGCDSGEQKTEDMTEFNKMEWMLGIWQGKQGDADLYESWRQKNFRILEGVSFTTQKGVRLFGQDMRIEQNNNKIYLTVKINNEEDEAILDLKEVSDDEIIFVNQNENEYPKKITYEKTGNNSMSVTIEGETEENSTKLEYKKTSEI